MIELSILLSDNYVFYGEKAAETFSSPREEKIKLFSFNDFQSFQLVLITHERTFIVDVSLMIKK